MPTLMGDFPGPPRRTSQPVKYVLALSRWTRFGASWLQFAAEMLTNFPAERAYVVLSAVPTAMLISGVFFADRQARKLSLSRSGMGFTTATTFASCVK